MTDERRYADDEVAQIFEAATTTATRPGRAVTTRQGLTLAELQSIGGEVGIAPERIAEAAASLERSGALAPRRTQLGVPIGVGRTVDLPRAPTDREWHLLLSELRQTFGAHGKDRSDGELRAWANGNLHAYIEPTETGHRLRMGSTKGNGVAMGWLSILIVAVALAFFLAAVVFKGSADTYIVASVIAAIGAATYGANALRLPGWASEREEQMERIATKAQILLRGPADPATGEGGS